MEGDGAGRRRQRANPLRTTPTTSPSVSTRTFQPLAGIAYAVTLQLRVGVDYDVSRFKVYRIRGPLQMLGAAAQFSF